MINLKETKFLGAGFEAWAYIATNFLDMCAPEYLYLDYTVKLDITELEKVKWSEGIPQPHNVEIANHVDSCPVNI